MSAPPWLGVVFDYVGPDTDLPIGTVDPWGLLCGYDFSVKKRIQVNLGMSTGYQIYDQHGVYFLTFSIVDWIDIFSRKGYKDIIIDSLKYCVSAKGLIVYGYVIMTNHMHIIVRSESGKLSDTIRDFKKFTAKKIIEAIQREPESRREWILHRLAWNASKHARNSNYQLWTHNNHAIQITSRPFFYQRLNYVHENPVRAGIVARAEDYLYSTARSLMENNKVHFELHGV